MGRHVLARLDAHERRRLSNARAAQQKGQQHHGPLQNEVSANGLFFDEFRG